MKKIPTKQALAAPADCKLRLQAISDALYAIGGKWKLPIIVALLEGRSRFNELQRTIEGISAKVLAAELKELELNGFVKREVFAGPPVVVEYQLAPYSRTLSTVLDALSDWGRNHRDKIKKQFQDAIGDGN
ncbi:transcriptional regulator [Flaviaesturariibacter flavus]|uniref:Transcriptional regulator n=1 Tax=Flaviaesturariibacter flavus TaxID=2502780 RepID=A0A4R1BBR5_9BACT|nr:helix-turn-helix domain-containing protein [Flaviaesturariibacter flavus]TCJ14424.1 transcriptional regulator [Flaviaesturariibacter flavus]